MANDFNPYEVSLCNNKKSYGVFGSTSSAMSSQRHCPFFNIQTAKDRGIMLAVGWTGSWRLEVDALADQCSIKAGLQNTHFRLAPGEKVRSPRVLVMPWQGDRHHGHNMLRRVLLEQYVPCLDGSLRVPLVTVNTCFTHEQAGSYLTQASEKTLIPLIKPFVDIGMEAMVIDAGWWDGAKRWTVNRGAWRPHSERFPEGFSPLVDALKAHDIPMGLWFSPEIVDDTSNDPHIRDNMTLFTRSALGKPYIDYTHKKVRNWFLEPLARLAEEGIAYYRQDIAVFDLPKAAEYNQGLVEIRHCMGLYQLWDDIRNAHPEWIMEGCCGGGRRVDLETLQRFHWHQKSDRWFLSEQDQCSAYGANMYLPGGAINLPTRGTDSYSMSSSFAGQLCLGWHPVADDFPIAQAKDHVKLYKQIRKYIIEDYYPLTPCDLKAEWLAMQFHRPGHGDGVVLVYRRKIDGEATSVKSLSLSAVCPDNLYVVEYVFGGRAVEMSGADISESLKIVLSSSPAAEIVRYRPVTPDG